MSARSRIVCLFSAVLLFAGTGRAEDAKLTQRVYQVADLVIPLDDGDKSAAEDYYARAWAASREKQPSPPAAVLVRRSNPTGTREDKLIKTITGTLAPRSWSERGGRGTIEYFPLTMSLVINQTPDVQEQIAGLLAALRRQQDLEVAVEVKLVDVIDEVYRSLTADGLLDGKSEDGVKQVSHTDRGGVTFLDAAGERRFLEKVQADVHSNVMQAPKLTAFNGQTAQIDTVDKQFFVTGLEIVHRDNRIEYVPKTETVPLGLQMSLRPIVAADRRSVQVRLDLQLTNLDSEEVPLFPITTPLPPAPGGDPEAKPKTFTQYIQQPRISRLHMDRTVAVPDGGTAVLMGLTKKHEGRNCYGPPVLSKIPHVGRLFRTVGYQCETHHLLVLVTPRVIITPEVEEKKPAKAASTKAKSCPCGHSDARTPVLPPVRAGVQPAGEEPSDARVLRALPPTAAAAGVCEQHRDNIRIVKERIVERLDAPRYFPLIGPAQLHHCHWKCTVYYNEESAGLYPVPFRSVRPRVEVVYIDLDHLHLCAADEGK